MMRLLILAGLLAGQSAGAAQAQDFLPPPAKPAASNPADPTWADRQKDKTIGTAATAPLDDLNLRQQAIPPLLTAAIAHPYAMDGLETCTALADEIDQLTDVLGEDIDTPPAAPVTPDDKTRETAGNVTVATVRSATTSLIPFRGWVRKLSGAERHQKEVDAAITAGQSRRAFLKGVGLARNCAPPAAPAGFTPQRTGKPHR